MDHVRTSKLIFEEDNEVWGGVNTSLPPPLDGYKATDKSLIKRKKDYNNNKNLKG